MKYRLDFDPEHRVLLVNLSDDVTEPEYLALRAEVERFLQIEGPCHGIIDFSGVSNFHISAAFTRKLAEEPPTFPASNIRVCVTTKPVIIGMIRMFQIIGGKSREKVYIVRTMEEAHALLDFPSLNFSRRVSGSNSSVGA